MAFSSTKREVFLTSTLLFALLLSAFASGTNCPGTPPATPYIPEPSAPPKPYYTPPSHSKCTIDLMQLSVCAGLVDGLIVAGQTSDHQCCKLLHSVTDAEAAVCVCAAVKAGVMVIGLNLNVSTRLTMLLHKCGCGKNLPSGGLLCT